MAHRCGVRARGALTVLSPKALDEATDYGAEAARCATKTAKLRSMALVLLHR